MRSKIRNKLKVVTKTIIGEIERVSPKSAKNVVTPRQAIDQWLSELRNLPPVKGRVLMTAFRNKTWIEWSAYAACVIRQLGFESTILYKGDEIIKLYNQPAYFNFWKAVEKIPGVILLDCNSLPFSQSDFEHYYKDSLESCVAALAYDLHLESQDIIENEGLYKQKLEHLRNESARNGARVKKLCSENNYYSFFCYSGLIRDTPIILKGARDVKQETVCVEGWGWRQGHMIYNFNAPSLEYNVRGWMNYLGKIDDKKEEELNKYFNFLEGKKQNEKWLNEFMKVQQAELKAELPEHIAGFVKGNEKVFLLACNVIGDSSLLNRETIFKSHRDFVKQTIKYFSERPDIKLIIRAHPGEGIVKSKVAIKIGDYAIEISKGIKNILVINDWEKINTFSLMPYISTGIVWISSVGVDMVVRGIPVIAAAKPKYFGLGIVEEPRSREEFFFMIDKFAKDNIYTTTQQILAAKEYLYLIFKGFSFEAYGKNFRANTCKLNAMPNQKEHDMFYKILLRLEQAPDKTGMSI